MKRQAKLLAPAKPQSLRSLAHLTGVLRRAVATRLMRDFGVQMPPALIRRVIDEAVETAEQTGFPDLFFPAVAEEKARFVVAALGEHPRDHATRDWSHAA